MIKIWNGKVMGIPSVISIGIGIIFRNIANALTTVFSKLNLGGCGKHVVIQRRFVCRYPSKVFLSSNVIVGTNCGFTSETDNGWMRIADGVSIGNNCNIDFSGTVSIDKDAHIAHNVTIVTHTHGLDYRSEPIGFPLTIGEGAFIGNDSIILYNVKSIGKGAVIGAGAVITKEVPDGAVAAGNPARIIKYKTL